jgi:hypothetical protein
MDHHDDRDAKRAATWVGALGTGRAITLMARLVADLAYYAWRRVGMRGQAVGSTTWLACLWSPRDATGT